MNDKLILKPNSRNKQTSHTGRVKRGVCCIKFWVLRISQTLPSCCQVKLQRGALISFGFCTINHFAGLVFFKCRFVSYLTISNSGGSLKMLKSLCCMKGGTPAGSMKPLSHPAAPPPPLSWSPLRLFAQAVALKTAHSVWMFFSQARAAGYMFAFPLLSKATFTSGPEEKGSTVYESMQAMVGSATLKLSARLVCAGRRKLSWRFYLFTFFVKGACIPYKSRCGLADW